MISNQPYRATGGKLAAGIVMAVVVGALTPLITVLEMSMLMPVICLSGVFMVFLACYAGRMPAWLFMMVQMVATARLLGAAFMWMLMAAGTFPAILALQAIALKRPFFRQMRLAVISYGLGLLAAVTIAYGVFGGNMIGRLTDALGDQIRRMPDEFFAPFVRILNGARSTSAIPGIEAINIALYRAQVIQMLPLIKQLYQENLPGALLSGAALSGVLTTLWGNWLNARHGLATDESYIGVSRWFLAPEITFGLVLTWAAAYILLKSGYAAGPSVYAAAYDIIGLAFIIQAVGAMDRFLFRRGASDGRRRFMVGLSLAVGLISPLVNAGLMLIGAGSALFGSHGSLRALMDRFKNDGDHSDHNDDSDL